MSTALLASICSVFINVAIATVNCTSSPAHDGGILEGPKFYPITHNVQTQPDPKAHHQHLVFQPHRVFNRTLPATTFALLIQPCRICTPIVEGLVQP
jgi:hypothetical protein